MHRKHLEPDLSRSCSGVASSGRSNVRIVLIAALPPTLASTASEYAPLTLDVTVTVSVPSLNESSSEPTSTQSLVAPARNRSSAV